MTGRRAALLSMLGALLAAGCSGGAPLEDATASAPRATELPLPASTQSVATIGKGAPRTWWKPAPGQPFHIQLTGTPKVPAGTKVAILDGEETSAATVAQLRRRGVSAVCYFNAGGYENFRADRRRFPSSVLGKPLDGWPGERWLDLRQTRTLLPIMASRMDACRKKGFVAVDPDNMDGYLHPSGFPLKQAHAVAYQKALAKLAHDRGLAIGLKNAMELLPAVGPSVDFAVNEECLAYDECGIYARFVATRKPVFHVEYEGTKRQVCAARPRGFSSVLAGLELDGATTRC